ncbi:MAG: hypothetical protein II951_13310 [Bacteroidales bacterium]|nr:hypothetical protein [Bacteroidales bacterium]
MKNETTKLIGGVCLTALVGMTISLSSCTVRGTNNDQNIMSKEKVEENVREFVYPLPTAFEVTEMLNRIDAAYILDICNDPENVDKYITEVKRAMNMGVYSADLCYASTYNQSAAVRRYTQTIRALVDALDMTQAVDPELATKMVNLENNKEGMTELISNSFYDSYDYLNRKNRGPVSILIVAGSWVEGLYIATHISDDTFDNKEMVKIVMSQKEPLDKLVELLGNYPNVEAVKEVREQILPLYETYRTIDASSISEDQVMSIKKQANAVREYIVKP